ncbi:MAG: prepilin-type N-terminal cleavage/methylation domain-containing protein [Acidobacteriia bacterium]|nr:prepilin-type N-terminal cleavage/methylation domain-containing protein [Terriglobia bacterium]
MNTLPTPGRSSRAQPSAGFSLLEVMFATVILAVGLLALLAVFAQAVSATKYSREDQIAKQKAREALEGVYSARNDTAVAFADIQNISNGGIFKDGFQPLYLPGTNGIVGTAQDTTTFDRTVLPGPDGKLGTGDDVIVPLVNYQRQILITSITNPDGSTNPDLRRIAVTIRVASPERGQRDYVVSGFISRYP